MKYPRIIFAGTHSGVGKTTLACGIMLALKKKGLKVQPFKAGPDYIDPTHHTETTGMISCNLDNWLLPRDAILELFERRARNADISIIEGVMGLYDGLQDTEEGSTAHLSKILKSPVVLILDSRSLSRSGAAIVLGYREFDKELNIAGVILNNIGSKNHYDYIKGAIESKTKIPVFGYLPKHQDLKLAERHLGLIPAQERKLHVRFYKELLNLIEENMDIEGILRIARQAPVLPYYKKRIFGMKQVRNYVTIAVAKDKAFNFYYQDNLDILSYFGAKIVEFSPVGHKRLPKDIAGLYIGGGFPEIFAEQLSKNINLKKEIYKRAQEGLPIYAECGGLMYLVEKLIDFEKREFSMVGIFKGSVIMANRLQSLGYINIETIKNNILSKRGDKNCAHIFHWSYLDNLPKSYSFAYKISRPFCQEEKLRSEKERDYDGLTQGNVLASYVHLHFASNINLAKNFIKRCKEYKNDNT